MADTPGPAGPANNANEGPKQPPKQRPFLLRTPFICASLLLLQLSLALTLFFISYRKFLTWYKTTHHLHRTNDLIIHTTLFIATCAPLCSILGIAVAAAYYWRKRLKYGKYDTKMRRKGRGYWIDPSDGEDKSVEDGALRANAGIRRERTRAEKIAKEEEQLREQGVGHVSFALPVQPKRETKRISFFSNPYGWVAKNKSDAAEEGAGGGGGLGRSDSVRTCESDETTRKGVADIWLGRKGSNRREEDIEMVTRRT